MVDRPADQAVTTRDETPLRMRFSRDPSPGRSCDAYPSLIDGHQFVMRLACITKPIRAAATAS